MPLLGQLEKARGVGKRKVAVVAASVTGTGTISTGLGTIEAAVARLLDAESAIPSCGVEITGITGGDVSVVVVTHDSAANAVSTHAHNVQIEAIGYS